MSHTKRIGDYTGSRADKYYKDTLFEGDQLMIGINCLEPGQTQTVHDHKHADKAYIVIEGEGTFTVGEEQYTAGPGEVIFAPAGVPHGVENTGAERLVIVVSIAPPPGSRKTAG